MAHGTLIGGTSYGISGGKTLIGGTGYTISGGKTLIGGTSYTISFTTERDELRARLLELKASPEYSLYSGEYVFSSGVITQWTIAQHVDSWLADSVHNNPITYPIETYRQAVADAEYSLNYYIENSTIRHTWNMYSYNATLSHDGTLTTNSGLMYFYVQTHHLHKYATNNISDMPTFARQGSVTNHTYYGAGVGLPMWLNMTKISVTFPYTITESGWYTGCVNEMAYEILGRIIYLNAGTTISLSTSNNQEAIPSAIGHSVAYYPSEYSVIYSKGSILLGTVEAKPNTYPTSGAASYTGNDMRWFELQN